MKLQIGRLKCVPCTTFGYQNTGWEEAHIKNDEIEEDSNNVQDESNDRLQPPHHCLGIFQLDRQVCALPAKHLHHLPACLQADNKQFTCELQFQDAMQCSSTTFAHAQLKTASRENDDA